MGVVLETRKLTKRFPGTIASNEIDFDVRSGEVHAIIGENGAGKSTICKMLTGLYQPDSGEIYFMGRKVVFRSTGDAIKAGIAMVNEDRKGYGLVLERDIHENISLVNLNKFIKGGFVDDKAIEEEAAKYVDMLQIKIANTGVKAGTLSGGNQQKVVLAKWLMGNVRVMILDEPTRGIDVGAKSEIHRLMCSFAKQGMAVIMISSELPEVLGMSDRVVVMQEGRINGILDRAEATQESIMTLATKGRG